LLSSLSDEEFINTHLVSAIAINNTFLRFCSIFPFDLVPFGIS